jgi:hypothetical protein
MACSVPFHAAQKTSAALKGKSDGEFQLVPFIGCQVDDHGVFLGAKELGRVIVGIAEDWMKKRFACALYGDALVTRPADIHCVR